MAARLMFAITAPRDHVSPNLYIFLLTQAVYFGIDNIREFVR